jgi:hypothetical protein
MYSSRPTQSYHFQADLNWCDGTFKTISNFFENYSQRYSRMNVFSGVNDTAIKEKNFDIEFFHILLRA